MPNVLFFRKKFPKKFASVFSDHGDSGYISTMEKYGAGVLDSITRKCLLYDIKNGIPANLFREISLLRETEHDNILRLGAVYFVAHERDGDGIYLKYVFPDCKSFTTLLQPKRPTRPDLVKIYLRQILMAVVYLHSHKIVHGDLKPENLFIDTKKKILKVGDLSLRRALGDVFVVVPDENDDQNVVQCTSYWYTAPELLLLSSTRRNYTYASDVWSIGCIFSRMLKHKRPLFEGSCEFEVLKQIFSVMGRPNEETWPGITLLYPDLHNFPETGAKDLSHVFHCLESAGIDLLSKMLCLDPRGRITAASALKHPYFDSIASEN